MSTQEIVQENSDVLSLESSGYSLVLWNDEVNTFDWVIKALMDICHFGEMQAEQCSLIVHFNGKCAVLAGEYHKLKPKCDAITNRGINATIEELAKM